MTRFTALTLSAVLLLALCACGGTPAPSTTPTTTATALPTATAPVASEESTIAQAYYGVVTDLLTQYGEPQLTDVDENDNAALFGLCYVRVRDFDYDGTPELHVCYAEKAALGEYRQAVYTFRDGQLVAALPDEPMVYYAEFPVLSLMVKPGEQVYLDESYESLYIFRAIRDGKTTTALDAEFSGAEYEGKIDGKTVTGAEAESVIDTFIENSEDIRVWFQDEQKLQQSVIDETKAVIALLKNGSLKARLPAAEPIANPTTEQAAALAYYGVLCDLFDEYGAARITYSGHYRSGFTALSGIGYVRLLDFEYDGMPELYIGFGDDVNPFHRQQVIYSYIDGALVQSLPACDVGIVGAEDIPYSEFVFKPSTRGYFVDGASDEQIFHTIKNGKVVTEKSIYIDTVGSQPPTIDGQSVTEADANAALAAYTDGAEVTHIFYMGDESTMQPLIDQTNAVIAALQSGSLKAPPAPKPAPTPTPATTEQAVAAAYYNVVADLIARHGEGNMVLAEDSQSGFGHFSGVSYVRLLDFEYDGMPELFVVFNDAENGFLQDKVIYSYIDGELVQSMPVSDVHTVGDGFPRATLIFKAGQRGYFVDGHDGDSIFCTLKNGKVVTEKTVYCDDIRGEAFSIDGQSVTEAEANAAISAYTKGAEVVDIHFLGTGDEAMQATLRQTNDVIALLKSGKLK